MTTPHRFVSYLFKINIDDLRTRLCAQADTAGFRVLDTYALGEPVSLSHLQTKEDYQIAVQGAALAGDLATFHQALDQAPAPLSWPADVYHPFYLAFKMKHAPELFERVADAEVISELADKLSSSSITDVDLWLAAGVMAGAREAVSGWEATPLGFPRVKEALVWREALERQRQAEVERPGAAVRRPRPRT